MKTIARIMLVASLLAAPAAAQTKAELHLRHLQSVPIGALPPMAILMPASRNHNYWVGRVQAGAQSNGSNVDRYAVGAGIDLQWRGGSSFGLTAGYHVPDCDVSAQCPNHTFYGGRARINLITGGPTLAALIGDASATTTLGTEIGLGYAPNAFGGRNACAMDIGMPISVSMFQRIRVLTFFGPGIAWDLRCPFRGGSAGTGASALLGSGIGFQQLGLRGLDVSLGVQQIFKRGAGVRFGVSVNYVRLP